MDGDPGEGRQDPHRLHRFLPAPLMHHEQGVLTGAGAVHPVQPARHPEPGLIEPGDRAGGDVLAGPLQEPLQPPGGPGGEGGDRPSDSGMPNSSASACAVRFLDRNCPAYRQMMTAATRGPYCTGASAPSGAAPRVRVPAAAFPLDQLMLGDLHLHRRQVKDLAALHPGDRPARQRPPRTAAARPGLMPLLPVRPAPPAPAPGPGARPARPAYARSSSAATATAAAAWPTRRRTADSRSSATSSAAGPQAQRPAPAPAPAPRVRMPASSPRSDTTSAVSTSYDGGS